MARHGQAGRGVRSWMLEAVAQRRLSFDVLGLPALEWFQRSEIINPARHSRHVALSASLAAGCGVAGI